MNISDFKNFIKVFFGFMEDKEQFWKRKKYEKELKKQCLDRETLEWLEKISFEDELDANFESLDSKDNSICIAIAIIITLIAIIIDDKGKDFEDCINKSKIKDFNGIELTIKEFDTNNIFDLKRGKNHRYVGHDLNLLKKIPGDYVLPNGQLVNEVIGSNKQYQTFYTLIEKYYDLSNKNINFMKAIFKAYGIHLIKDIVTPEGLPLPLTSIFTKFEKNYLNMCGYSTKNSVCDILGDELGKTKCSDISSWILEKTLMNLYIENTYKKYDKKIKRALKNQMNISIDAYIIVFQMLIMLFGKRNDVKKIINGGKNNITLFWDFVCNCRRLLKKLNASNKKIINAYKNKRIIWEVALMKKNEYKEFSSKFNFEYHFENDENCYLGKKILDIAYERCKNEYKWTSANIEQLNQLYNLEDLKIKVVEGKIEISFYREEIVKILKKFSREFKISVFEETKVHNKFYEVINNIYKEMEEKQ